MDQELVDRLKRRDTIESRYSELFKDGFVEDETQKVTKLRSTLQSKELELKEIKEVVKLYKREYERMNDELMTLNIEANVLESKYGTLEQEHGTLQQEYETIVQRWLQYKQEQADAMNSSLK